MEEYDVIVVGAGFAGATVARECATRGLRTLVLEGRDRVGGRTWTSRLSNGEVVELGGTYVHWLQPHTWSEISRYGLEGEVVDGADPFDAVLLPDDDGGLTWCTPEEYYVRERALFERVFAPSVEALPRPYDPFHAKDALVEMDRLSIRDRLDQLDLGPGDDAMLASLFSTETADVTAGGSYLSLLRWWAPAGNNYDAMMAAVFGYKMKCGIVRLAEAMLADGGADVRLGTPAARIVNNEDGVEVTSAAGETWAASAVVVATPAGVWPYLDVSPPLSPTRLDAAAEGLQGRRAAKVIAVIRGESRGFYVVPRRGHAIGAMWTIHKRSEDEQVVVVFAGPTMRDARDEDEVRAAITDLMPNVELVETAVGTYYEDDEFSRGGWSMLKRGQMTRFAPHDRFSRPEGRVLFATSDIARLWCGFVDGAIESGLQASREAMRIVDADGRSAGARRALA